MASKRSSIVHQPQPLQAGFLHLPRKKPKSLPQSDELASKVGDNISYYAAKDLRIKRVFSPNLDNRSSEPSEGQISDKDGPITANGTCPNGDSGVGKISITAEVRNENFRNSNGCVELGDEDRRCDGKSVELVHSTPPDAEVLAGGLVAASSNGCPRSSHGSVLGDICAKADCRIDSVTRTGSVLKPCSKRKLFKAPGSIAYKRLLPFLLDGDNYILQGDLCSKREKNLKKENIESNLCNRANESSFIDSDTSVNNAVLAYGISCNTMKLNSTPPDNGDAKNFQNGSDSRNDPTLVKENSGLKRDVVSVSSLDKKLTENGGPSENQIEDRFSNEQSKTFVIERLDGGDPFISSNLSSEVDNFKSHVSEKLCNNVSEDIKSENHSKEEIKISSLDSDIACNLVKEERKNEKVSCTRGTDQYLGSSTVGENDCNIATESDKKYGPCVRNKVVRNPLVQLKSKYNQVSVSYRRMLPFLEDLFKDNPENCASGNIDSPRPEKELPTMNLQSPSSNSHNSRDRSEGLASCNMPCDGSLDTPSMPGSNTMNEMEMLDTCMLKVDPQLYDQAVLSSYDLLTGKGSRMVSQQSPITSEGCTNLTDNVSDAAKLSERNSLEPNPLCVEACVLPARRINVGKGIRKQNPRGCRGICNCLNCSSFRLHAERAFEFSRNQLQDAKVVASDLMKELSFIRDVLEKCSDGAYGDAGYHSNKVKEACRKASEAELVAKNRLLQMNCKLDIQSRIMCPQRPNVRFSSEIKKRKIEGGK
ncbi:uncharacterized protein LOC111778760 isoform X2 [Cucurbita pepo subsp. pepo]|uniref:uncharacterized protein LOC111778760 isoform X2 n=1 Tax=Cucurbita pepo subsp. pepo TaxID=3664 RepID=UPI000C9D8FAD|nr:uncharacterized protein LOC111778760 isoform X2 [Cucurbita pepo subsp. pepo]